MRYWVVMAAAGTGRRFGGTLPKQHWVLGDSTVLQVALQVFVADSRCVAIAVALSAAALADTQLRDSLDAKVLPVAGGAERADSVLCGLAALAERDQETAQETAQETDWVLVHDAARPCLSAADLDRLLAAGAANPVGALLAAPVTDTLKSAGDASCCERTVDRAALWRALTPQMFRFGALRAALHAAQAAGRTPSDEAQAMEWQGARPLLVAAADSNIKITNREDLAVAAAIIAARQVAGDGS